ncbi:MAG: TetR/AcrR family transcriptional regulator [Candidatus Thiodiazotropha sp. (ex Notomyrtea botanica)]|nr:TetR/AcrR family transcriptional regulator [Candidatus Thiodiazotropha sp. (ex Notomyrtea botanica)]
MDQSAGRRARRRQETTDRLVTAAWSLFESQGFEQVTMEAIAEAADVAKGTLYKHFPAKEALLQQAFHREMHQTKPRLMAQLEDVPAGKLRIREFFRISAEWSEQRRNYLPHYLRFRMNTQGRSDQDRSGTDKVFRMLIEAGVKSGDFRQDLSLESAVHYLSFLYLAALVRWLDQPGSLLMEELDIMLDLFLSGIGISRDD